MNTIKPAYSALGNFVIYLCMMAGRRGYMEIDKPYLYR